MCDMAEILAVLERLHGMAERPLSFDAGHCAKHVALAISAKDWLVLVVDSGGVEGVLIASAGETTISPERVAIEHAWIAPSGWGARLAEAYEAWAAGQGCTAVSLSCHPRAARLVDALSDRGFSQAELTMVKSI